MSKDFRRFRPDGIAPPFGRYVHGIEIPPDARIVTTSGQLGLRVDLSLAPDALEQARQCFANCGAVLADAGMAPADTVRIAAFVTDRAHMADYMRARDEWLDGAEPPVSTLLIVTGFTRAEFLVEVEVTAARIDGRP